MLLKERDWKFNLVQFQKIKYEQLKFNSRILNPDVLSFKDLVSEIYNKI